MTVSIQILQIPETETVRKREHFVSDCEFTIGRDYSADICLPDSSSSMSRKHIKVERLNTSSYAVTDISANGAKINGTPLPPKKPTAVADGDVLDFCGYRMLLGIVSREQAEVADPRKAPVEKFHPETDFDSDEPILRGKAVEREAVDLEPRGFSGEELDLEPDLLFDPFAEGPEMREPEYIEADPEPFNAPQRVDQGVFTSIARRHDSSAALVAAREAEMRARFYKTAATDAMERAFERFLQEIDPETVQADYDVYLSIWASRKKRYWQIHKRQFAKQRQSGEFRRAFMAMFAEEMRKR